jgi:putative zinc finger/helix-turn-helix YgiT family protein
VNLTKYCPFCDQETKFRPVIKTEEHELHGEKFTLENIHLLVCEVCGNDQVDESHGDPLDQLYTLYRARCNLLRPDEIASIRKAWGLSQVGFAELLGMSPATVNRYEMGSLQSPKDDILFRACTSYRFMKDIYENRGHILGLAPKKKFHDALNKSYNAVHGKTYRDFCVMNPGGKPALKVK